MSMPDVYNKSNTLQNDMNTQLLERYLDLLTWKKNEYILDIGIGDGKFTTQGLLPNLPQDLEMLIGCDLPHMVQFARQQYSSVPKVKFVEMDMQTRELREDFVEKFDHVFSFYALNWVHDLRQGLENMFLMMKPGSEFLIIMVEKGMDDILYNLSQNPKWAPYGYEKYISKFRHVKDRLPIWRNLLQDTGFVDLNCFREKVKYRQASKDVNDNMFMSLDPVATSIPKEDREEYKKDFLALLRDNELCTIEMCPETQEEICYCKFVTIIVHGKKPES